MEYRDKVQLEGSKNPCEQMVKLQTGCIASSLGGDRTRPATPTSMAHSGSLRSRSLREASLHENDVCVLVLQPAPRNQNHVRA